jgi:hypothetical protein
MIKLETLYSSNIPVDCHILKGRLASDGLDCYLFDENIVWIHPFKAVAVGGVKLKVPSDQIEMGNKIINLLRQDKLIDENGEYNVTDVYDNEIRRQNEVLDIKTNIRKNPSLIENYNKIKTETLNQQEIRLLINSEKEFQELSNKKLNFTWKVFFSELFDFDGNVFRYLRLRPVDYYIDKDIVDNYNSHFNSYSKNICPNCKSKNVSCGYALDYKWGIAYLFLSLLLAPFPLFRKKYHCFDCGFDFKHRRNGNS